MRAVASSSPSVKNTSPETPVRIIAIRPHPSIGAGVSVFGRLVEPANKDRDESDPRDTFEDHGHSGRSRRSGRANRSGRSRSPVMRFDLDREIFAAADPPLEEAQETTFGALRDLVTRSGHLFAPAAAVDLLSRRDHSEAELRQKLRRRGFSADAIEFALQRMQDYRYQDDDRFAESWVRSRMSGVGRSRNALVAGLARKGVDRETVERAIRQYEEENPDCFREALLNALTSLRGQSEEQILRKLYRRGFDVVEIKKNIG